MRSPLLAVALFVLSCAQLAQSAEWRGFAPPVRYPAAGSDVVIARDLDGDGFPELLASGNHVDQLFAFSLLRNRGDGTFDAERPISSSFGEELEDTGDLNGDGIVDLVASNYWSNGISIYYGRGSLQFSGPDFRGTATHGGPTRMVDYDNDGRPDLISLSFGSGNPVRIHRFHNDNGMLGPKTTTDTNLANGASLTLRQFNGGPELLVSERSGNLARIQWLGTTTMLLSRIPTPPSFDIRCAFADVDGDGIADIVDTNEGDTSTEPIFVSLGKSDGGFSERHPINRARHLEFPANLTIGDVDGDGHLDLIVSDFRVSTVYFFRGDGTGGFAEGVAIDVGGPANELLLADINGDGRLDLITANDDHSLSVLLNRGVSIAPRRRTVRR